MNLVSGLGAFKYCAVLCCVSCAALCVGLPALPAITLGAVEDSELTDISGMDTLKADFAKGEGKPRLVLLLSPT